MEGWPQPHDGGLARQTYGGQAPGVLNHILLQGLEHRTIFKDNKAYKSVLTRGNVQLYLAAR
jgi:hypothetical protein